MIQRLLIVALSLGVFGGCATKRDLQNLQAEIGEMQAAQDRLLREIQRQNATILDSLHVQDIRMRGDITNQLVEVERQMVQIQELTGQGQQRLTELREALEAREEALARAAEAAAALASRGDPEELFLSAEEALERGSTTTARTGFEELIGSFPQDPRTPAARLYLATILYEEEEIEPALEEYARILELHPDTPEAPSALFRAALIEREEGNVDRARSMLNQLTAAYPSSPEADNARDELREMR